MRSASECCRRPCGAESRGGLRADVSVDDAAAHDTVRAVDSRVDIGAVAYDEGVVALDFALELAIDSHATLEVELALDLVPLPSSAYFRTALIDRGDFVTWKTSCQSSNARIEPSGLSFISKPFTMGVHWERKLHGLVPDIGVGAGPKPSWKPPPWDLDADRKSRLTSRRLFLRFPEEPYVNKHAKHLGPGLRSVSRSGCVRARPAQRTDGTRRSPRTTAILRPDLFTSNYTPENDKAATEAPKASFRWSGSEYFQQIGVSPRRRAGSRPNLRASRRHVRVAPAEFSFNKIGSSARASPRATSSPTTRDTTTTASRTLDFGDLMPEIDYKGIPKFWGIKTIAAPAPRPTSAASQPERCSQPGR